MKAVGFFALHFFITLSVFTRYFLSSLNFLTALPHKNFILLSFLSLHCDSTFSIYMTHCSLSTFSLNFSLQLLTLLLTHSVFSFQSLYFLTLVTHYSFSLHFLSLISGSNLSCFPSPLSHSRFALNLFSLLSLHAHTSFSLHILILLSTLSTFTNYFLSLINYTYMNIFINIYNVYAKEVTPFKL